MGIRGVAEFIRLRGGGYVDEVILFESHIPSPTVGGVRVKPVLIILQGRVIPTLVLWLSALLLGEVTVFLHQLCIRCLFLSLASVPVIWGGVALSISIRCGCTGMMHWALSCLGHLCLLIVGLRGWGSIVGVFPWGSSFLSPVIVPGTCGRGLILWSCECKITCNPLDIDRLFIFPVLSILRSISGCVNSLCNLSLGCDLTIIIVGNLDWLVRVLGCLGWVINNISLSTVRSVEVGVLLVAWLWVRSVDVASG